MTKLGVLHGMAIGVLERFLGRDEAPAPEAPADPPRAPGPEAAESALRAALAQKLLYAWLQNRQQVRAPLTLNLGRMETEARLPIMQTMAVALAACGKRGEAERARLAAALVRAGAKEEAEGAGAMLADPPELLGLIERLQAGRIGAEAYAAAALLLDRREPVERAFLDFLAARLGLPLSLTTALARRYGR